MTSPEIVSNGENTTEAVSPVQREYELRLETWRVRRQDLLSVDRLFSRIRLVTFLLLVAVGCVVVADRNISAWWSLAPLTLFAASVFFHRPYIRRLARAESAHQYYIDCLKRLKGEWKDFEADGSQFSSSQHPWSSDLDVFGKGSLFQKLNQCRTLPAQRKLADWLTTVPSAETVAKRQTQIESLIPELDLREQLAAIDSNVDWAAGERAIIGWLATQPTPVPKWVVAASRILGVITTACLILVLMDVVRPSFLLLLMLLQGPFVLMCRGQIRAVLDQVDSVEKPLRQLADVMHQFETFPFREKSLQQLQQSLISENVYASQQISRLSRLVQWLNNALRNQFFIPVAWATGMFVYLPYRIESWRMAWSDRVSDWMATVTTLEVLSCLAGFSYEQESGCRPEISESQVCFEATGIGHPLIPDDECVRNDVSLTADVPLMLISGSNMSGKSTLLRSIGSNLVLAYCGARVKAESLRSYPFQLGTAMRISDSLQEGRSLFFSVIQRLKSVVDLTRQERPVLFLLDEILSGTNSHDRRHGAEAVIRSLVDSSALGLVTTHDLTLTKIVDSLDGRAVNMHFEDQITDGQMTFDYQLRTGVVERTNAIELMRMMGLDV